MSQALTKKYRFSLARRLSLLMAGDIGHADFREIVELLGADANLVAIASESPEVIVVFHSRPLAVRAQMLLDLQKVAPLAGVVIVAGSWCEGELRTGRV